jgi:two-component system, OmpR family, phosphate regulon sensor histidine kinase PhoR
MDFSAAPGYDTANATNGLCRLSSFFRELRGNGMSKFRMRLTLIFIILIGLSVAASGLFTARLLKNSYIESMRENLKREIHIVAASSDWVPQGSEADQVRIYTERVDYYKKAAGARMTVVRADGKVLADSEHDPATMDNHLTRAEIIQARDTGYGQSIRHSDTIGEDMLYVALPVKQGDAIFSYLRLSVSLASVDRVVRQLWLFLLGGLFVLFLIAGLVSYRIAQSLTRPIERMTKVAQQITGLNYRSRVSVGGKDEIGQLGRAINSMAASLEHQVGLIQEEESRLKSVLENMNSGVVMIDRSERIVLINRSAERLLGFTPEELQGKSYAEANLPHEMTKMIGECLETREQIRDEMTFHFPAERIVEISISPMPYADGEWAGLLIVLHDLSSVRRLERMRSEFVANVSHELKTPIAAVKGFAETLLAGALDDRETAQSFLRIIYEESERLNRLIGDILELSKIESRQIPLHFSPVEMKSFVERSLQLLASEAQKKRIDLEMSVGDGLYLEADEDRLQQIIFNLVQNGINYTPEGGKVKVKVEPAMALAPAGTYAEEAETMRITIADTGIGIPKKDLPRIFERFYRVDKARSRSSGGTGLGLSIVKHLVELHRGSIAVESEQGVGTRFMIDLPVVHPY